MTQLYDSLNHKILSEARTRELLVLAKTGDREAAGELIQHNERLVYNIAKKYYSTGATGDSSMDDLMQEGRMGLLHAITKFDMDKPVKFSTYATWWIRQRIRRFGIHDGMTLSMAYSNAEKRAKALHYRAKLSESLEREPTNAEICTAAGVSGLVARSLEIRVISLDGNYSEDPQTGTDLFIDKIIDHSMDPESTVEQGLQEEQLQRAIKNLSPLHQEVLYRFYVFGQDFNKIGEALGKSKQSVRIIKDIAIKSLRAELHGLTFSSLKS